jgi:ribosome biogenesis GTPase A
MDFNKVPKISWFPGHMNKALRQLNDKLGLVDVVVEVLDARVPESTRNAAFAETMANKAHVILLFKTDLADPDTTAAWRDHYQREGNAVITTHYRARDVIPKLLKRLEQAEAAERKRRGSKYPRTRAVRAMILGLPNVGKSSLINLLVRRKHTKTGHRPGVTRHQQWIKIGDDIELLDTPGIMYPRINSRETSLKLGLVAAIKEEHLGTDLLAEYLLEIMNQQANTEIMRFYELDVVPERIEDLLEAIGRRRGMLLPGDEVDPIQAANAFVSDFREGVFGRISLERPGG